jgi:hypothetical protein
MNRESKLCCPVCKARFRGAAQCSRCSADLTPLMLLTAHAYALRQASRRALKSGDARSALVSAQAAQGLHATAEGGVLEFAGALVSHRKEESLRSPQLVHALVESLYRHDGVQDDCGNSLGNGARASSPNSATDGSR